MRVNSSPVDAELTLRIGLLGTGMVVLITASTLWGQVVSTQHAWLLILSFIAWLTGILLIVLGLVTHVHSRSKWLIPMCLISVQLSYAYTESLQFTPLTGFHTDNEMIAEFAVQALKSEQNPYQWNFTDILRVFRDRGSTITPFLDGAYQHRVTYPVLPTLALYVFDLFGLGQARVLAFIFQLLLLVLLFVGSSPQHQPIVLLPLFILKPFVSLFLGGVQDVVWSTLLVSMLLCWRRSTWRALLFGLACSFRQQPWFVAPFLIILLCHESHVDRVRRILYFIGISVSVFVLINLPFMLWDFHSWILGAFEPLYAAFNVTSQGLGALSQYGLAALPREFYTLLQLATYSFLVYIYWRYPQRIGQAFWIFPGILFWLYYRGLANYWLYWIPPLLVAVTNVDLRQDWGNIGNVGRPGNRSLSIILVVGVLVSILGLSSYFILRSPLVRVSYAIPLETNYGGITQLKVTVTNESNKRFVPRFAVQSDQSGQPLPWRIVSGPEYLNSQQTGEYVISSGDHLVRAITPEIGAQLVVTDAGGDYSLRNVLTIPAEESYKHPDLIRNSQFRLWPKDSSTPQDWTLPSPLDSTASIKMQVLESRNALRLDINGVIGQDSVSITRLTQLVTIPASFSIWVYPTAASSNNLDELYGIEIEYGERRLWILFGESTPREIEMAENQAVVYIQAPLHAWSQQHVNLTELLRNLKWPLPTFSSRPGNGLLYPAHQVRLSLIAGSNIRPQTTWFFGAIEQNGNGVNVKSALNEALNNPDQYYANLGSDYLNQRNYDLADQAYRKAISHNPSNPEAHFGLGKTRLNQQDMSGAIEAFQTSIRFGYQLPGLAHLNIGQVMYQQRKYSEAEIAFRKSIESMTLGISSYTNVERATAYNGLGWTLLRIDRCDAAIPYFEAARWLVSDLASDFPVPDQGLKACQGGNS
jgi:uncharacterized membrane protein